LFYRLALGTFISFVIAGGAALFALLVGVSWGAAAGFVGGKVDAAMMRIVDVLFGLPYILMVILMKVALTHPLSALLHGRTKYADLVVMFLAIGSVSWLTMARVIRSQVLTLREAPFIEAARAIGASPVRILVRHVLPNLSSPIVVYVALIIPQAILQEAFLSYLGIGVSAPLPSLGRLAADGVTAVNTFVGFWWLIVFPCGTLVVMLLAFNFIADALRDTLDPK